MSSEVTDRPGADPVNNGQSGDGVPSGGSLRPATVRNLALLLGAVGIAGMIIGSIRGDNGVAIGFGGLCAIAALSLLLVSAVVGPAGYGKKRTIDESRAAELEARIGDLVTGGADEDEVRSLVRFVRTLHK